MDTYWYIGVFLASLLAISFLVFIIRCYVFGENNGQQFLQTLLSSVIFSTLTVTTDRLVWKISIENLPEYEQTVLNRYGWLSDKLSIVDTQLFYNFVFLVLMILLGFGINKYYNSKK